MDPVAELLTPPPGYGTATSPLEWPPVRGILERAPAYWIATVRPDGRPHTVPRDGFWVDDALWYGGSPDTVHNRNILANPQAVAHVGEYAEIVIVEGAVAQGEAGEELRARLAAAHEKYPQYGPPPDPESFDTRGLLVLRPRRVLAWTHYPENCTRFRFG